MTLRLFAAAFAIGLTLPALPSPAQEHPASGLGTLGGLVLPRKGKAMHEGSWDRGGGNGDLRGVDPGQTLTLMDYKGAGMIRRFWVTIAPRSHKEIHRQAILRMYWDGEETPSVEVPIGDFFGVGFGEQKDYISLPLNETSGGYNCYWPMPFHKSAKWTITNMSKTKIDAFYYNIDFTGYDKLPKDMMHFHAQWRRENPTIKDKNYTILEASGRGHFVGVALYMQNRKGKGLGFLEGDEMIYLDGEEKPSIIGTGTEDYFSSGWYYDRGLYSAPYHGINIKDEAGGRISTYRWHIEDAMPFTKSVKVTIEHGTNNDHEGDYSSVAFFYQQEPHAPFPAFPVDPEKLLPFVPPPPFKLAGAIEAENLRASVKVSEGPFDNQPTGGFAGQWSNEDQLWWRPTKANETLTLNLPAPIDGEFEVVVYLTKAKDYGKVQFAINEANVGSEIDLYDVNVTPTGAISLGKVKLKAGDNQVKVTITGKNDASSGYLVGIDCFVLKP
jgi:hypothetical protein